MEWSCEMVCDFIEEFKKRRVLWNYVKDPGGDTMVARHYAWEEIATTMDIAIPELKRKWTAILATLRKERRKVAERSTETKVFEPKWYCYPNLDFIKLSVGPKRRRRRKDAQDAVADEEEEYTVIEYEDTKTDHEYSLDETEAETELVISAQQIVKEKAPTYPKQTTRVNALKKRKLDVVEESTPVAAAATPSTDPQPAVRDECDAFGMYIAAELRKMERQLRAEAKREISMIIFNSEMQE